MVVELVEQSAQFQQKLQQAGSKPVFVDFFATWCGPCKAVAPKYDQLSNVYNQALFLKIDVDEVDDIAQAYGVTAMPTFMYFKDKQKKEELKGGDPNALEEFVKKWATSVSDETGDDDNAGYPKGQVNLNSLIDASKSECLNESDEHKLEHALTKGGFLESDVDEQLLMTIAFSQQVKLHSFKIRADGPKAPKTVKFFVNLPNTPDFDAAEGMTAVQEFTLSPEDMQSESIISMKYVKFQNVQSVTVFVNDNQGGEETTQIDNLVFIGSTVSTTNMNEFKRVAGKKGESH